MNTLWSKFFRAPYRRDPVSSFILTVGAVDAVIGGVDTHWPLFLLGMGAIGTGVAIRWWKAQPPLIDRSSQATPRYLPANTAGPTLPTLQPQRKRPHL